MRKWGKRELRSSRRCNDEQRLATPMPAPSLGRQTTTCNEKREIAMKIHTTPVRELRPYSNNARTHSKKQIRQIANSIQKFGFCNPVLIDNAKRIIAGHGRVEAAKLLGIDAVPTCRLSHWPGRHPRSGVITLSPTWRGSG
jgi:ParB-like nuclease domain